MIPTSIILLVWSCLWLTTTVSSTRVHILVSYIILLCTLVSEEQHQQSTGNNLYHQIMIGRIMSYDTSLSMENNTKYIYVYSICTHTATRQQRSWNLDARHLLYWWCVQCVGSIVANTSSKTWPSLLSTFFYSFFVVWAFFTENNTSYFIIVCFWVWVAGRWADLTDLALFMF